MSTLITGGTGFLGAHLARLLVTAAAEDVVLYDHHPAPERIADLAGRVIVVEGDILDADRLTDALARHRVERIAHFAFMSGTNHIDKTVPYVRLTCVGTANVFEAALRRGVRRVVNASTMGTWSPPYDEEKSEDDAQPSSFYGATKLWTEHLAHAYNTQHDTEIISLRIPAAMGKGRLEKGSYHAGLMAPQAAHFMAYPELAAVGCSVLMPPDDQLTEFCYAPDVAEAFRCALTAEHPHHEVYSVTAERRCVGDMTRKMRELLPDADIGVASTPHSTGPLMSNRRLVDDLGFAPRYTLESGLEAYLADVGSIG